MDVRDDSDERGQSSCLFAPDPSLARRPDGMARVGSYLTTDCFEAHADLLGRLGFYQIPTTEPPRTRLVSLALSRAALIDSLVVIVLDWQKPWTFIRELEYWIEVLEEALGEQSQTEGGEDPVEEGKRRGGSLRLGEDPPTGH